MKRLLMGVFLVACFLFAAQAAKSQDLDLSILPADAQEIVENRLSSRFPPELKGITLDPEEPVAGEPTTITVKISNDKSKTSDETGDVYVLYMVNWDMEWQKIELDSDDGENWTGEFPGFESDDEVVYAIHAIDNSDNVFTTVPCTVVADEEIMTKSLIEDDCVHSGDLANCSDNLPRGCLMRMALDDDPLDDPDDDIPPFGDLQDLRIGYDDDYVYIDLVVETKIEGGTMQPTDVRAYVVLMLNPDVMGNDTSLTAMLPAGGVLGFAPLAKQFESTGMVSDCFFGYAKAGAWAIDTKAIKCFDKSNHLILRVSRDKIDSIGDNPSGILQFIALGAQLTQIDIGNSAFNGNPLDISHWTAAHFTDDTYFVVK